MDAIVTRSGASSDNSVTGARPCVLRVGDFEVEAACGAVSSTGTVRLAVRPERVQLGDFGATGQNRVPGMVERLVFLGSATQVFVRLAPGALLQALVQNTGDPVPWSQGTPVSIHLPSDALRVLVDRANGAAEQDNPASAANTTVSGQAAQVAAGSSHGLSTASK
jgi:hypothetical protein